MIPTFLKSSVIGLAATALSIGFTFAAPYAVGNKVTPFIAQDQHEQGFMLNPAETHFILASHDMDTGKKANAVLTTLGKDFLGAKHAIYIANIHGMPGIGRMFALPKMKKYTHRIILADDADLIAKFPQQPDKVTILKLTDGTVTSVAYWAPGTEPLDPFLK